MALAILIYRGGGPKGHAFDIDSGTNKYYGYVVGRGERRSEEGHRFIAEPSHMSPVLGPLPDRVQTRHRITVPYRLFDRENGAIQLYTFRTRDRQGPAYSSILDLRGRQPFLRAPLRLSPLSPSKTMTSKDRPLPAKIRGGEMPYRELPYSTDFSILAALGGAGGIATLASAIIPALLIAGGPIIGQVIQPLIARLMPPGKGADINLQEPIAGSGKILADTLKDEKVRHALAGMIESGLKSAASSPSKAASLPVSLGYAPGVPQIPIDDARLTDGIPPGFAVAGTLHSDKYSYAKLDPATLIGMFPLIMPLIEKVLTPEVVASLIDAGDPGKMLNAVVDGVTKLESQRLGHIERIVPDIDRSDTIKLLKGLSLQRPHHSGRPSLAEPVEDDRVDLVFLRAEMQRVHDQRKVLYVSGRDIRFPLQVRAPVPIDRAILRLQVKMSRSRESLLDKSIRFTGIRPDSNLDDVILTADEIEDLPRHEDLLLNASLRWKDKRGTVRGTRKVHMFTLVDSLVVDRIGAPVGEEIPLNDVVQHRPYWHKVWEGGTSEYRRWEATMDCKYYVTVSGRERSNQRWETRIKTLMDSAADDDASRHRRKLRFRVKSGVELSLDGLNRLLPTLGPHLSLSDEQLEALGSEGFLEPMQTAARIQFELKGRSGDTGALWVFPELQVREVALRRVRSVDELGQIAELEEELVRFPFPSSLHFVGVRSK